MKYTFTSKIAVWGESASWHYVRMPKDSYEEIKEVSSMTGTKRGFGSVKVEATVGQTTWQTSLFPDAKDKSYIMFIKKAIRKAEKIDRDSALKVDVELLKL